MSYTLEHVIDECVAEKASNTAPETKRAMYEEAFAAMNVWIESRMSKRKGAEVGSFGTFTWELKTNENGDDEMRPLFLIADSFVKDHRVKQNRIHYFPRTATNEEINHSKIAIKFTNNLTKDMVFCSLRDIIRKIGDFVARGYEFTVPFTFGLLMAKERRVRFEFSYARFADILPADVLSPNNQEEQGQDQEHPSKEVQNVSLSEASVTENSKLMDVLDKTLRESEKERVKKPPVKDFSAIVPSSSSNSTAAVTLPAGHDDATAFLDEFEDDLDGGLPETNQSAPGSPSTRPTDVPKLQLENTTNPEEESRRGEDVYSELGTQNFGLRNPPSPRMLELLIPKQPRTELDKKVHTINARQSVIDEAFNRMLTKIERETLNDEYTKYKVAESENSHINDLSDKQAAREKVRVELQQTLDQQVHEFEERQRKERDEIKNSKMSSIVEDNVDKKMIRVDKSELCGMLMTQMSKKEEDARGERERKLEEERAYLDHIAIELDMQNAADRANHLSKQSELLEAWEREGHVKNLKKLQASGINAVHGYIRSNLMEGTPDVMGRSYSARSQNSARANMSVGYDPRAGKPGAYSLSEGLRKI